MQCQDAGLEACTFALLQCQNTELKVRVSTPLQCHDTELEARVSTPLQCQDAEPASQHHCNAKTQGSKSASQHHFNTKMQSLKPTSQTQSSRHTSNITSMREYRVWDSHFNTTAAPKRGAWGPRPTASQWLKAESSLRFNCKWAPHLSCNCLHYWVSYCPRNERS